MSARRRKGRRPPRPASKKRARAKPKKKARKPARAKRKQAARKRPTARKRTTARKRPASRKRRAASKRAAARAPVRRRAAKGRRGGSASARASARSPSQTRPRAASRDRLAAGVPVEVGVVTHWFPRVSAAVVVLSHPIHLGDTIHVRGHSTDFVQTVTSLALEGAPVREGAPRQELGVKLDARARPGDRVYRVSW